MKNYIRSNAKGFSLIELIITVGLISTVMVGVAAVMPGMLKTAQADEASAVVVNTLRLARDRAIGERRNMDVVFTLPNRIQIVREEIVFDTTSQTWGSSSTGTTNTTVLDTYLSDNQRFQYFTGMADTPDGFGTTNAPLAFGPTPGTISTVMFTSEGTLVDPTGDSINGTVFLGLGSDRSSARAITIFGTTALVRGWKWDGAKWIE
jgi:prepilin-type N-terminal cleavage/methylation domain-containing protein